MGFNQKKLHVTVDILNKNLAVYSIEIGH
jgi:hypothetical protein